MSLTICMTTSRMEPCIFWMLDSLNAQISKDDEVHVLFIWLGCVPCEMSVGSYKFKSIRSTTPKPNVWQGDHKLTKDSWWAVSNSRNTALCLCKTDWILFLDDRCVLQPGFMDAVREAMTGKYRGPYRYEKRQKMVVENGVIKDQGILQSVDSRETHRGHIGGQIPFPCPGRMAIRCCLLMPLECKLCRSMVIQNVATRSRSRT